LVLAAGKPVDALEWTAYLIVLTVNLVGGLAGSADLQLQIFVLQPYVSPNSPGQPVPMTLQVTGISFAICLTTSMR
jgi:hypothetical protein